MQSSFQPVLADLSNVIEGKEPLFKKVLCCLLSDGHVLLEDLPGTGKTSMAQAMARVLGLSFSRVQFTSDLLPSDVLGALIYVPDQQAFRFQKGPVFAQLLLADEINRASARTQSALLEAMAEQQVTLDGKAYPLPDPFFVMATQNPQSQLGTFPLPESQLDRFMLSLSVGYPSDQAELALLKGEKGRHRIDSLKPLLSLEKLMQYRAEVAAIHVSNALAGYVKRLIDGTRQHSGLSYGISPRGGLALVQAAKAWAWLEGRNHVLPEDVQTLMVDAWKHRLELASAPDTQVVDLLSGLLDTTPVV